MRSARTNRVLSALHSQEAELTPIIGQTTFRMLSAKLSPVKLKAEPEEAMEALEIIAFQMLPERALSRKQKERPELAAAKDAHDAVQAEREAAESLRAWRVGQKRAALAASAAELRMPKRWRVTITGRVRVE